MAYDSYGRVTVVSGTVLPTFQYAGNYQHQTSGLGLTKYRAFDSNTGRWLSRDPSEEQAGPNLYDYVTNDPIKYVDPLGLDRALGYDLGGLHASVYVQTWSDDCCKTTGWKKIDFNQNPIAIGVYAAEMFAGAKAGGVRGILAAALIAAWTPVPGMIEITGESPPPGTPIYKSSCCDDKALLKKAYADQANPPIYDAVWYNCRHYAHDLYATGCK